MTNTYATTFFLLPRSAIIYMLSLPQYEKINFTRNVHNWASRWLRIVLVVGFFVSLLTFRVISVMVLIAHLNSFFHMLPEHFHAPPPSILHFVCTTGILLSNLSAILFSLSSLTRRLFEKKNFM